VYPTEGFASHVFGYVGEVNARELEQFSHYRLVTSSANLVLRNVGKTACADEEVGSRLRLMRTGSGYGYWGRRRKGRRKSRTHLDANVQRAAETALQGKKARS